MNQVTHEERDALTKTFAIVGFVVLVILAVWLAVQIVSFIPSAFSSLASLADSVYNYKETQEIKIAGENNVYNTGESFTLSWEEMRRPGTYTFSYGCVEGVSIDAKKSSGEVTTLTCGEPLTLGEETSLSLLIASEKNRFTDIPYTVTYTKDGASEVTTSVSKDLTVVNVTIPATGVLVTNTPTTSEGEKAKEETPVTTEKPATAKPTTYVTPKTVSKVVYTYPVSDPKGKIDLQVTYLGSGTLSGSKFTKTSSIDIDENGAIQFEIKNIGTKTTDSWSYVAKLPADITYTSGSQKALKPNERAIITLGFEGLDKKGVEKVSVEVTAKNDVKTSNDKVNSSVTFKN